MSTGVLAAPEPRCSLWYIEKVAKKEDLESVKINQKTSNIYIIYNLYITLFYVYIDSIEQIWKYIEKYRNI